MQRPRICANRGEEIGENDPSHPTGILGGFDDCSCVLSPRRATLGAPATGSRSPLNWRLTEKLGALAAMPAPTVGSAKNGIRPTNNRASAVIPSAPAMRTNSLAIGLLRSADTTTPAIDQAHEKPPSCPQHHWLNVRRSVEFHSRLSPSRDGWNPVPPVRSRDTSRREEQRRRAALVMADGHPFPPPPVLGRSTLGAVDMPIGCALIFSCGQSPQSQGTVQRLVPHDCAAAFARAAAEN